TYLPNYPIWYAFFLLIIPLISLLREYLIWWNRQYVITSRRVIQISGIINKNVIDSSLEKVNDVKMVQSFWGRLYGYGNVEILTASELGVNLFKKIGNPIRFKTTMLNAKSRLEMEQAGAFLDKVNDAESAEVTSNEIPALIERLGVLREKGVLTEEEFEKKKAELLAKL
ncbi:PH domain-containing protein, partial [bacterium]